MVDQEMVQVLHDDYIRKAVSNRRELYEYLVKPEAIVTLEQKENGSAGVIKRENPVRMKEMPLSCGSRFILDFGNHQVGYVTLRLSLRREPQDSPAYIRLKFGEDDREILERSENYHGWISRSWIQEEFIHIDILPAEVELPRRYAFRYMKLEVIDTSPKWELMLEDAKCRAVSAMKEQEETDAYAGLRTMAGKLAAGTVYTETEKACREMEQICKVSLRTLKNCMQDVFEDGSKRDRRLWLGDLRLQALADYASFQNYALVKRCLCNTGMDDSGRSCGRKRGKADPGEAGKGRACGRNGNPLYEPPLCGGAVPVRRGRKSSPAYPLLLGRNGKTGGRYFLGGL